MDAKKGREDLCCSLHKRSVRKFLSCFWERHEERSQEETRVFFRNLPVPRARKGGVPGLPSETQESEEEGEKEAGAGKGRRIFFSLTPTR